MIVPWCSGSTSDFGSASLGSSPGGTTENIDYQYFTKQTPNFTPLNVKLGVLINKTLNLLETTLLENIAQLPQ